MNINDFVDYHLRRFLDDEVRFNDHDEIVQVTLRLPVSIRNKADVVSQFVSITRNALFVGILEDGVQQAFDRLKDNPVTSDMRVNDRTPDEAYLALSSGEPIVIGLTLDEIHDFKDITVSEDIS